MKKSTQSAFMPPPDYGKTLTGPGIKLLSRDIDRALIFQRDVLGADLLHEDPDLLIVRGYSSNWMMHGYQC
jgi:hypothetical protein